MSSNPASEASIVALAGGVGASRFLSGLVEVVAPRQITVIGNTGDDREFYGVHVSPDLDIVTYTLANQVDRERGYGLSGDTYTIVDQLAARGHEAWFRLGDRDFANCLHRTLELRSGSKLCEVTAGLAQSLGLEIRLLPMSEDPCPTLVELEDGRSLHFEEYLVRERSPDNVTAVDLSAAAAAKPAPGVLAAIAQADAILLCPSNPVVSIGPILTVPGVREAIANARAPVVAVSPIVGSMPIKGPADRLLRGIGVEVSARGVASHYSDFVDAIAIDSQDADQLEDIRALGLAARAIDTIMVDRSVSANLARVCLELADEVRGSKS
jgi:LPPG:FO 2-phospho-L-lactate transferase